jgi:hypothetical protein
VGFSEGDLVILIRAIESVLIAATVDFESVGGAVGKSWSRDGDNVVAKFPSGQACMHGPIEISGSVNVYWEVAAENRETYEFLEGISISHGNSKSQNSSNAYKNHLKATRRPGIRNSSGSVVGFMPAHVIAGMVPEEEYMDGEDIESAAVISGLDELESFSKAGPGGKGKPAKLNENGKAKKS